MAGSVTNLAVLCLLILATIVCIFGPLTVLGVMFWHWHKELRSGARLRMERTTQTK